MASREIREKHSAELCTIGEEVYEEALRGIEVHGEQADVPLHVPEELRGVAAQMLPKLRLVNDGNAPPGVEATWFSIMTEELTEAMEEPDPLKRADELVQLAAVAQRWAILLRRQAMGTLCLANFLAVCDSMVGGAA